MNILQETIFIVSVKKITTITGLFYIGISNKGTFYFDFVSETGDYFIKAQFPEIMEQGLWNGTHPLVIDCEVVSLSK